ncbi:MAG: hypothetical protein M2R45_01966 [Verrucomicrobia subdivision 3 bacterium]|nr:hypothetical protein [Limisphaerales bacterium]MCS1416167.1 hypothetical protein [Limisphaerales bacterium]
MLPQRRLPEAIAACLRLPAAVAAFDLGADELFEELIAREFIEPAFPNHFREAFVQMDRPMKSSFFSPEMSIHMNSLGAAFDALEGE